MTMLKNVYNITSGLIKIN